ncbi:ParA family protein [Acetobacter fabarum]|uniref:ParA family protein n=1 Tax=Acetobacter fabarum TaxID=483199 RepID=UPI0039ED42C1
MIKLSLFNHKGGVGKTTLSVNIARELAELGKKVLLIDADPQCNLTSFYLSENQLEKLLESSDADNSRATIWTAVKPIVEGQGPYVTPVLWKLLEDRMWLVSGDVMLAEYEEVLPEAWTECYAGRRRGFDITTAISRMVDDIAKKMDADIVIYDVGPNVGALNRTIILDCDYFITPVAADLFSLRALNTVGRSLTKWINSCHTIRNILPENKDRMLHGQPKFLGYITSAYKVSSGRSAADPHEFWENKIAPRITNKIIRELMSINPALIATGQRNKIGAVKNFHSLAPHAQELGISIGNLRGHVNPGHYSQVDIAKRTFRNIANEILLRTGI